MKRSGFRIVWLMVIVAVIAIDFAVIQAMCFHPEFGFVVPGFLPMVSILVVVNLIGQKRPRSRSFQLGLASIEHG